MKIEEQWRQYNKKYRHDKRLQMTLDEYKNWLLGKKTKSVKKQVEIQPVLSKPIWANTTDHIESVVTNKTASHSRSTMVEKVTMGIIQGKDADMIMEKSKRVGLITSKGAYGYIDDGLDLKTLGKKSQQLE